MGTLPQDVYRFHMDINPEPKPYYSIADSDTLAIIIAAQALSRQNN